MVLQVPYHVIDKQVRTYILYEKGGNVIDGHQTNGVSFSNDPFKEELVETVF